MIGGGSIVAQRIACLAGLGFSVTLLGCDRAKPDLRNDLGSMPHADVTIGEHRFRVWVAADPTHTERGLMNVTADEMTPLPDGSERGMLFVFDEPHRSPFWMKNTIIPLDIAFLRADGTIINIHTMAPLDTRGYFAKEAYRYALEVRGNVFSKLRISSGQKVQIPETVLKHAP